MSSSSAWTRLGADDMDLDTSEDGLSNGASVAPGDHPATSNDGMSDFSTSDISLPEVCVTTNFEETLSHEVHQAYRIFSGFLLDKHKAIAGLFLHAVGHQEAQSGVGGVCASGQARLKQSMCLRRIEEKFINLEYHSITEFVADFRLMLENCYRYHGVDHWLSKQGQKLEIMLEQKLTLLSRTLREKTTLAVTSKGRFGPEEERAPGGTSTRRRSSSRSLTTITVGGHESVMVQALRMEEQQRAKEEKRQRELEKKEAEEMSAKAVEEWEQTLLTQASPHTIDTLWELPAIGHFLCLAQTVLNLPEIVFFELERCLLMPRCSSLLSKIMSTLLSPCQRRATLHRRPALPYRRWEAELRQRVKGWYRTIGGARDQPARAEQLGLCHQFFHNLGEASPLEEKPFHSLPLGQRVWLLKGLCDHVYETQKDVQDAVLAQPIHECRESILGYDSKDNAYIHFPHFCGADLRIYRQSPSAPPPFPFPSALARRLDLHVEDTDVLKDTARHIDTSGDLGNALKYFVKENGDGQEHKETFWPVKKEDVRCRSLSSDGDSSDELSRNWRLSCFVSKGEIKQETTASDRQSTTLKESLSLGSARPINEETQNPCLNVGEHTYTGRSPARRADTTDSSSKSSRVKTEGENLNTGHQPTTPCLKCRRTLKSVRRGCKCPSVQNTSDEDEVRDRMWSKKKKCKKKRGRGRPRQGQNLQAAESALQGITASIQRKDKRKKTKEGKKGKSAKKIKDEPSVEPAFKLVCTSLQELRELISKIEDELDELESAKNQLDRWFLRKQSVKELHSTLIRLLNELSPWEPKLMKAHQRNRLRLKKEFDDFKKHPEYNNFIREERLSSSSSSSEDGEDIPLFDRQPGSEDEMEHVVPKGLWIGASTKDLEAESVGERSPTFGINQETSEQSSRVQADSSFAPPDIDTKSKCEMIQSDTAGKPVLASSASKLQVVHLGPGLPKGYTPIPTLLAKSVGNKVTLLKRPVDYSGLNNADRQSKGPSSSLASSTAAISKPQPQSISEQNSLQGKCAIRQTATVNVSAAPLATDWAKGSQTLLQTPLQGASNVPEGPDQLVRQGGSNSLQSVLDYGRQEKMMPQVVMMPSKHVIENSKEQQLTGPMYLSTSVSGFTIPDNVQPPDVRTVKTPSLFSPPCQQHRTQNIPGFQVAQPSQSSTSSPSSITSTTASPPDLPEDKQELKTICIRDSQSILVTTRGGNTGIVKVQTSSALNALDGLSTSPIITISPQFKAFLASKSAEASSVPFQKDSTPTTTVAQSQQQLPSVFKSSAITNLTDPSSLTPGISDVPTITRNIYHPSQTLATHSLMVKNPADVTAPTEVVGQSGLKRPNTEEQPKVTKFILVNPSSSSSSSSRACTVAVPKETSTNPPLGSRVVVINQPSVTPSGALMGSVITQSKTAGVKGQQMTTSSSSQTQKVGLSPGFDSNALSKKVPLPTGLQIHLSGMTTTIGQSIGALSRCTSQSTPPSVPATTSQSTPFPKSNTVTSCLSQLVANSTLTRTSQPQSFTITSELGSLISNSAVHGHTPVQKTSATVQGNPKQSAMATFAQQPSHVLAQEANPIVTPLQKAPNPTQSHAVTNCTQFVNSTQQRIVINTSKPLAAGTQILLNNTCFVVPPQGLGPGSHVLIISSPSPQKVPKATVSSIGSATPSLGVASGLSPLCAKCPTAISPALSRSPTPSLSLPSPVAPPHSISDTTRNSYPQPTSTLTASSIQGITSVCKQAPSVIHQPIKSTMDALETAYMVTLSPPPAPFQPVTLLTTNPVGLTNHTLVPPSLQKSTLGMAKKLLVSPDGAIMSSVPRQAQAAEPSAFPKATGLILTPNSSGGAWHHQLTPSQPNN
ncbi:putative bromodomain-containing protein 10 isoform 1-T2 [Syngnathus typhle]